MSDMQELQRIGQEAEAEEAGDAAAGAPVPALALDLSEEFAEFLDLAAKVGGVALRLPVAERFTHAANVEIAGAAVKLCEKYGMDARSLLIGQDSTLGAWLGLGFAVGMPAFAVHQDWKAARAKEVRDAEGAKDGEANRQQPSE